MRPLSSVQEEKPFRKIEPMRGEGSDRPSEGRSWPGTHHLIDRTELKTYQKDADEYVTHLEEDRSSAPESEGGVT